MIASTEIQQFPLWEKLKNKRLPLTFDVEITARCNLNCRHCYINMPAGDQEARSDELTLAEILDIAKQAVDLGTVWCLISGGEPLLREDFIDIYLGLKCLGLLVSVFTNGTMFDKKIIGIFKKYPPRDIELTVYGITQSTYEAVTRKAGSFARFSKGIELLRDAGVPFRLKAMAIQSNFHEQQEIANYCRTHTKDYFRFDPQLHLRFDRDPIRNAEILSERLTPAQIVALDEADQYRIEALRKNCRNLIKENPTHSENGFLLQCGAGVGSFAVSYDGRFRLCSSLWADGTTYDLKTGSLDEAWREFVPQVRGRKNEQKGNFQKCSTCELFNLCFWCPAHAYLESGDVHGDPSYFCEVANQRADNIRKSVNKI